MDLYEQATKDGIINIDKYGNITIPDEIKFQDYFKSN